MDTVLISYHIQKIIWGNVLKQTKILNQYFKTTIWKFGSFLIALFEIIFKSCSDRVLVPFQSCSEHVQVSSILYCMAWSVCLDSIVSSANFDPKSTRNSSQRHWETMTSVSCMAWKSSGPIWSIRQRNPK